VSRDHLTLDELGAAFGGRAEFVSAGITKEHLEGEIASLQGQRERALKEAAMAEGAILAYRALLDRLAAAEPAAGNREHSA
jgi:hypothetical protein